jgi:SP family facilitated glucose transporter-like MFS transporter 3
MITYEVSPPAVFFYSSLFFEGVIDNPLVGTTMLGAVNVVATYLALNLLNRYGRRTLVMVSSGGMCVSCVLLIISMRGYFGKMMPLIAVAMCVIFYGIGIGPIPVSSMRL